MAKCKEANLGSRDRVPGQMEGSCYIEIEDRRISKELHSDEQSADRRLSFTAVIYTCLRYQQSGCISSETSSGTRISSQNKGRESSI